MARITKNYFLNFAKRINIRQLSSINNDPKIKDKFRGCLVGALIGDCYGKPFKLSEDVSKAQLQKYFEKLDGPYFKAPYKPYSSNTALSLCLGHSLTNLQDFNAEDVAKRFVKEFYDNPHRDYGSNMQQIFQKLRGSKFKDPYGPASETYLGMGSFGNSAAARVAPIVLFHLKNEEKMIETVKNSSNITNAHQLARNGAILQSWAIRIALESKSIDSQSFLSDLAKKVEQFETDEEGLQLKDVHKYRDQLFLVEKLLQFESPTEQEVVDVLGHAKIAAYSVPTAIYCFLRGNKGKVPGIETDNSVRRVVQLAVLLGGDADTIASMAGALVGAASGYSSIGKSLQKHCEGTDEVIRLADKLSECLI